MAGGFCTIESNKQNNTRTPSPPAIAISRPLTSHTSNAILWPWNLLSKKQPAAIAPETAAASQSPQQLEERLGAFNCGALQPMGNTGALANTCV